TRVRAPGYRASYRGRLRATLRYPGHVANQEPRLDQGVHPGRGPPILAARATSEVEPSWLERVLGSGASAVGQEAQDGGQGLRARLPLDQPQRYAMRVLPGR